MVNIEICFLSFILILERKEDINQIFDIPYAKRKYLENNNSKLLRKTLFIFPLLLLVISYSGLRFGGELKFFSLNTKNVQNIKKDNLSILGHLPYEEVSQEKLILVGPDLQVHIDMSESLLKMKKDAENDGVGLVFLSGFRSINLQKDIFYSLKSIRNQVAAERARVSAPPGYSEHSTGFAIDIGDANRRETDFEVEFETTEAFKWLELNAAKYHFKLSFNKDHHSIDYEPWHWRYEGSIEALKIFENANRKNVFIGD